MNIIFGKYQLTITQTDDGSRIINNLKCIGPRFAEVYGFGRTRIRWVLAQAGSNINSRISAFMHKKYLINRELLISETTQSQCFRYIGVELKQLNSQQRSRKYRFLTSFKLARTKAKGKSKNRERASNGTNIRRKKK
jgi:hypothetical protein